MCFLRLRISLTAAALLAALVTLPGCGSGGGGDGEFGQEFEKPADFEKGGDAQIEAEEPFKRDKS
ncbi:hypothetical protein [Tautonia plasticadhaerens]|uniref:Secreted protein n=1 Tax=Tautonia plasticadhaerens TaxID=2527974 RepID=A0A518HCQ2_9BACT|nr:hypothetical protein [Tautonia plasticadhaerens]QDV38639.1 hypothetical protein ElP_65940 [Tautonia plasticadhaerens]